MRIPIFAALMLMMTLAPAAAQNAAAPAAGGPTVVVLDFPMAQRLTEYRDENRVLHTDVKDVKAEMEIRGWWFSSQNIYFNDNLGRIAADLYTDALRATDVWRPYSRQDLKHYYADKKDKIAAKLKLKDEELDASILKLDPVAVGRELGVDKVVVGRICDSERRHSRTFGYFGTAQSLEVVVFDVATGTLEHHRVVSQFRGRRSQYAALEEEAAAFAREYTSRMTGGR